MKDFGKSSDSINCETALDTQPINLSTSAFRLEKTVPRRLLVDVKTESYLLPLNEIMYMVSAGQTTEITMCDATKYTSGKQLGYYELVLDENPDFLRIHRSRIVNKNFVSSILRDSKSHRFDVVMRDGKRLIISYLKRKDILYQLTL